MIASMLRRLVTHPSHPEPRRTGRPLAEAGVAEQRVLLSAVTGDDLTAAIAPATTDLRVTSVSANGFTTLTVQYAVDTIAASAFRIGAYRSADTLFDGADTLVDSVQVSAAANLSVGSHTLTFTIGTGAGQLALPGITGVADVDTDYNLLVVLDDLNAVTETDADAFNEDNTKAFSGVYHSASSPVMVFGTGGIDTISAAQASSISVTFGATFSYTTADVTSLRVRGEAGNDSVSAIGVSVPLFAQGGSGNDSLTGGNGNDSLTGGLNDDTLDGRAGNDSLTGSAGNDSYLFSAASSAETDTVVEAAGGGTDTLSFAVLSSATSVAVNLSTATTTVATHTNRTVLLGAASQAANWENATGGAGNDTLIGNAAKNVLDGGTGNDSLFGFDGIDSLTGGVGNDSLNGGGGNDTQTGGTGNDVYQFAPVGVAESDTLVEAAGGGTDTLDFTNLASNDPVTANLATATTTVATHTNRTVLLGAASQAANWENVNGGAGNDVLAGNAANNALNGKGGGDRFSGAAGNDALTGGAGNDVYVFAAAASAETDTVVELASGGTDKLDFTSLVAGDNVFANFSTGITTVATHTNRTVLLGALSQAPNWENITGGAGDDTLQGNDVNNVISALGGNDVLFGHGGNDTLNGGGGNDQLLGGAGNDSLTGGTGNDGYLFDSAASAETDTVVELAGGGTDTLDFETLPAFDGVTVNLATATTTVASHINRMVLLGDASQAANWEFADGGAGDDTLTGNAAVNRFFGLGGNDFISGGDGDDLLLGGDGDDTLNGGNGTDTLDGGNGTDVGLFGETNTNIP